MTKKVFISQPMKGKTKEDIIEERWELVKYLEDEGYVVVPSIVAETPEEANSRPVYYLSKSIKMLSMSDCAYFMPGWEDARGCKIEHTIAKEYGIPIMHD
jgi:hypothetical protein